jgi:hypothetical protein
MAHIRLDDNEIELSVGELRIGTGDDAAFGSMLVRRRGLLRSSPWTREAPSLCAE